MALVLFPPHTSARSPYSSYRMQEIKKCVMELVPIGMAYQVLCESVKCFKRLKGGYRVDNISLLSFLTTKSKPNIWLLLAQRLYALCCTVRGTSSLIMPLRETVEWCRQVLRQTACIVIRVKYYSVGVSILTIYSWCWNVATTHVFLTEQNISGSRLGRRTGYSVISFVFPSHWRNTALIWFAVVHRK